MPLKAVGGIVGALMCINTISRPVLGGRFGKPSAVEIVCL